MTIELILAYAAGFISGVVVVLGVVYRLSRLAAAETEEIAARQAFYRSLHERDTARQT